MPTVTPNSVLAVGIALPLLATLFVALRLFTRLWRVKSVIAIDDWLIVWAWVLCGGLGIMMIVGSTENALAQPTPNGSQPMAYAMLLNDALIITEKMRYANNIVSTMALGSVKLSVLFFYRKIFIGKWFNIVSWSMIGIVSAWIVTYMLGTAFECGTHFYANWTTLDNLLTYCHAHQDMQRSMALSDMLTDVLILAIPVPLVFRLQMSLEKKIAVSFVFLLGATAIAASVTRFTVLWIQTTNFWLKPDGNLLVSTLIYWTMVELGLSIAAACLPTLRPLVSNRAIEASIKSVRSKLSLHSSGSSKASESYRQESKVTDHSFESTVRSMPGESGPTTDIYASDMEEGKTRNMSLTGITVQKDTVMKEERAGDV